MRESPALDVIRLLEEHGAEVTLSRPARAALLARTATSASGVALTDDVLARADCGRDRHRPLGHRLSAPRGHGVARRRHAQRARPHAQVARADRLAHADGSARVNITVIGTGYVGLVAGACLAETGNDVVCADVDAAKIDGLKRNVLPIYEPGLDALVERNQAQGRLRVHHRRRGGGRARPRSSSSRWARRPDEDGSADLQHVLGGRRDDRPAPWTRERSSSPSPPCRSARRRRCARPSREHAQLPFHVVLEPGVPEGRRGGRRLHEARPRRARRRERLRARA